VNIVFRRKIDCKSEQGQSLTEFALALPVLALLLFAVIQFGIAFNNYITLRRRDPRSAWAGPAAGQHRDRQGRQSGVRRFCGGEPGPVRSDARIHAGCAATMDP
jgi:hypothetical protein